MNENDWVRTKNGVFTRILSLTKILELIIVVTAIIIITIMIECLNGITYTQRDIKLSSPSLLELIKNRDIVNGYRVAHVDLLTRKIIYYNDEGKEKQKITGNSTHNRNEPGSLNRMWRITSRI